MAWLAFSGAVLAGLIAAVTAQWRQRVQLRHDREQQAAQLRHERQLADLAELRAVLDAAAAASFAVSEKLAAAFAVAQQWETDADRAREAKHALDAGWDAVHTLAGMQARVALRLGQEHKAFGAFAAFHLACHDVARSVPSDRPRPGAVAEVASMLKPLARVQNGFVSEAQLVVGSRID